MKKIIKLLLKYSPYDLYEIIRDKMNHSKRFNNQKKMIECYLKDNEIKKIQIGCGTNFLEGWLNTDLKFSDEVLFLDAGATFPIESDSFDFIFSEHLFEHLEVEQQLNMLSESYRILKKGGMMRIATPNLDFLFKIYSNPSISENIDYVDWAVKNIPNLKVVKKSIISKEEHYIYVINNFFKAWGHQVIHNVSSIKKLVLQCNFSHFRECEVGKSEVSVFQSIEKHGTVIPDNINLFETMVIEIIK